MTNVLLATIACIAAFAALGRAFFDHVVTKRRLRELELRAATLQRALKERSKLANEIAHEIKNPITAILCSAEALELLVSSRLEPSHRQCLHYIREYGDTLLHLVSDFLDLSRVEGGHIDSEPQAVQLDGLVESVFALLQANAIKKHVTLTLDRRSLFAWADARLCKQILFNLLHNSIKFVPGRGAVSVSFDENQSDGAVKIFVRDNGPGIPEGDLPVLFNPYADSARSENNDGSGRGLGLAVCRALAEVQGGTIRAFNNPEGGACFELSLPRHEKRDTVQPAGNVVELEHPLEGRRFLLINKEDGSRDAMAQLIGAWGAMVDQVGAAADAIRALTSHFYDAVLIDECAEGLRNEEVARMIENDLEASGTAVLFALPKKNPECLNKFSSTSGPVVPLNGASLLRSLRGSDKLS